MGNSNLEIWDALKTVDEKFTKPITGLAFKGTSISPNYVVFKMTEQFGPIGKHWGYTAHHSTQEVPNVKDGTILAVLAHCDVSVWVNYAQTPVDMNALMQTGVPVRGTIKLSYATSGAKSYAYLNTDAPMQAETRALSKACSRFGVAMEIYLGEWDADGGPAAATDQASSGTKIKAAFEARCKVLSVLPSAHADVLDGILQVLGIEKTDEDLTEHLVRILQSVKDWQPAGWKAGDTEGRPEDVTAKGRAGEGDGPAAGREPSSEVSSDAPKPDDAKIMRYLHGALAEQFADADRDELHELLKLSLPKPANGDLSTIATMAEASALVVQAIRVRGMTTAIVEKFPDQYPGHGQAFVSLKAALPGPFKGDMAEIDDDTLAGDLVKRTVNIIETGSPTRGK